MDDLPGLLARDFGIRPQGKSVPMSAAKSSSSSIGSGSTSARSTSKPLDPFDDVFGGPPKYPNASAAPSPLDSIFNGFKDPSPDPNPKFSSMPVYDKPVYDDDIFDGVPGMRSSGKVEYEDVFASISKSGRVDESGSYSDLLGGFGRSSSARVATKRSDDLGGGFDDLIPGFGGSSPPARRVPLDSNQQKKSVPSAKSSPAMPEDPFVVLETTAAPAHPSSRVFSDPLEHLGKPMNSENTNFDTSPAGGGIFDEFNGLGKSVPASERNGSRKDKSPIKSVPNRPQERSSAESFDDAKPKTHSSRSFEYRTAQSPPSNPFETNATVDQSPRSVEHLETADDVWLTVAEIPLFTQPTSAPPPSRPPPPLVIKSSQYERMDYRKKDSESFTYPKGPTKGPGASPFVEFEDFTTNKPQPNEHSEVLSSEDDFETNSAAAAAMKEAMDKAEAKFKHAKEVRERERDARSARSRDSVRLERDEDAIPDSQEWEDKREKLERERLQREREERERLQREREEREREQRRFEKEREEKEKARQVVDRATREARERIAADARAKAERAAVDKVNAEARGRAAERAAAEARDRAATEARRAAEEMEAREKSARDRAAAEAREKAAEKAAAERARADRATVDKVHAEARERAAVDAREKAAAAAKERLNKTENDLESFFGMGARPNSAPKQRASTTENTFDTQAQRGSVDGTRRTASTSSSTVRKASSTTSLVDDLSAVFGVPQSSGEFHDVEGETEERRRARFERHQRTLERAAKALAEKNERDMQTQMEQAQRHRFAEVLDGDIKRWAAGKEGNLRALLSTLQYVLWPECGWQPVSLTDLITGDKVKRAYRKATLCIHPDKVQQKGANLQQKYIAEKVFDLLKEAWNKFNSEELF